MPAKTIKSNNDQVVFSQASSPSTAGIVPTAPSDLYDVDVEPFADSRLSTRFGSVKFPVATATPVDYEPVKQNEDVYVPVICIPIGPSGGTTSSNPPLRPTTTTTTIATTTTPNPTEVAITTTSTVVPPPNPHDTIPVHELLRLMKESRKRKTVVVGVVGGIVGLVILGPIGAIALGAGLAIATKSYLKRHELAIRRQYQNSLDQPVAIPSELKSRLRRANRRRL